MRTDELFREAKESIVARARREMKRIKLTVQAIEKLRSAGLEKLTLHIKPYHMEYPSIEVHPHFLPQIRRLLGKWTVSRTPARDCNLRKPMVDIQLQPVEYPHITLQFQQKFPKRKNQKCKIVRRRHSYQTTSIVCE